MKNKCYTCVYRDYVSEDSAYSCCKYPGNDVSFTGMLSSKTAENAANLGIAGDAHGVANGWFLWPIKFDPVWLRACKGYTELKK